MRLILSLIVLLTVLVMASATLGVVNASWGGKVPRVRGLSVQTNAMDAVTVSQELVSAMLDLPVRHAIRK